MVAAHGRRRHHALGVLRFAVPVGESFSKDASWSSHPGLAPSPPLLGDRATRDTLWHFGFNRAHEVNEQLVRGREEIYFGYQFATKAVSPDALGRQAVEHYIEMYSDPEALRASFDNYRAIDQTMEQNAERRENRITIPVLGIGGASGLRGNVAADMSLVADNVTESIIEGSAHYPPEEAPRAFLDAIAAFLLPARA